MKIFVLLSRVPYPLDKGDKLRAYHQIKRLSKKHEVFLCCLSDEQVQVSQVKKVKEICSELEIIPLKKFKIYLNLIFSVLGELPYQVNYFHQRKAQKRINKIIKDYKPDHIFCQLIRTTEYVKNFVLIPKSLDYMDAFSKGMDRRADKEKGIKKQLFRSESSRLLKYENLIFEYFDKKCIISEQDKDLIYHPDHDNIVVIPNGVDYDFFSPIEIEKEFDLVFTGNMGYQPNINCCVFIAEKVLPLLKEKRPNIKILISGKTPSKKIFALENENIQVSGWVEDIRYSYAKGKIFFAPMQIGTGLQNKLLEAMSMGIPCITSKMANSALGAAHEKEILIGETPEEYAKMIDSLLSEKESRTTIGMKGRKYIQNNFSWDATTDKLIDLIER